MNFAYADPPYPGMARRRYADHPDYAGEVDHAELIKRLENEYDGWALSTSAQALQEVLALCPRPRPGVKGRRYRARTRVRVLAWCKPNAPPLPGVGKFSWGPVILRSSREVEAGWRDFLVCSPEMFTFRRAPAGYLVGSKPEAFSFWLFAAAALTADDEFHDLFPGSGAVVRAWEAVQRPAATRPPFKARTDGACFVTSSKLPRNPNSLARSSGLKRGKGMSNKQPRRFWDTARQKVELEGRCRFAALGDCTGPLEAAHTIGREHDPKPSEAGWYALKGYDRYVRPDSVIPACREHHRQLHALALDALGFLTPEEEAQAVLDAGGLELARRRLAPSQYRSEVLS